MLKSKTDYAQNHLDLEKEHNQLKEDAQNDNDVDQILDMLEENGQSDEEDLQTELDLIVYRSKQEYLQDFVNKKNGLRALIKG